MGTTLPLYAGSYGGALAPGRELISEEWRGRVCNARTIVDTSICICFGLRVSAKISIVCIYIIIYIELQLSFGLGFCWYPFRLSVPACLFLCPSFYFLLCQRGPNGFPLPHSDSYDVWQSATPPTDITEFPFAGVRGLHIHNPNMRNVFRSQH